MINKIEKITGISNIKLENVKVRFEVKLLQYNINNILYRFNQKFAFKEFVIKLEEELTNTVLNSKLKDVDEAKELLDKLRKVIKILREYIQKYSPNIPELNDAIDKSIRFILFKYGNNKTNMTLHERMNMLLEVKVICSIVQTYNLTLTSRIKNIQKLETQLKENILSEL